MTIAVRPYQRQAADAFKSRVVERHEIDRGLVVLPTGTGKTVLGLTIAMEMNAKTLWLAHREELIDQPSRACAAVWPDASRGIVKADRNEYARQVVFASVQTAFRDNRLDKLIDQKFDLVVLDEAHHGTAPIYVKILRALGCFDSLVPVLGLTATPERADNLRLDDVFQGVVYQYHLTQAITDGYLARPNWVERPIRVDLDAISKSNGDYNQGQLDVALMEAGIVDEVVAAFLEHARDRKTIIFTVGVKQSQIIAERITAAGIPAAAVWGEMPGEQRRATLRRLADGSLRAVVNCMVLTEGFDEPTVDCVLMARPTQSKPLYVQCVGRGLRLAPMKRDCLIIDMVGLSKRHTMVQAPVIFGATRVVEEEKDKSAGVTFIDAREFWRQRLSAQASGVKPIERSALKWIRGGGHPPAFLLNVGEYGTVRMAGVGESWHVEVVNNRAAGIDRQDLTTTPVTAELAQGIAEDYVRRCKATRFAEGGRWRDDAATEPQLEALRRWRMTPPEGLTRGEASDMLTAAAAKKYEAATPVQINALQRLGVPIPHNLTQGEAGRMIRAAQQVER